ncbi:MAG: hypothetical protein IJS24_04780, partial [Eubacterium sp.]|nr:hypothetical protein [Eubacterium sp.]
MSNNKRKNNNSVNANRVVNVSKNHERGGKVKPGAIGTPYDDVFRTMLTESDKLTIALLNEMFGKSIPDEAELMRLQNEVFLASGRKRVTDSDIRVAGKDDLDIGEDAGVYHMECESVAGDSAILFRLFEYNTGNAIQRAELDGDVLHVKLPWTGVLYLRDKNNTPDEMIMRISRQDESQSLSLNVPVMKMSDYPLDVVIEKKLWFLFPYCIFTYWRDLESKNSERFEKAEQSIMDMLGRIREELDDLNMRKLINPYERDMLERMTIKVVQSLAARSEVVTKGVEEL